MKSIERTAYHEAGHAVLAHFLGVGLKHVSIIANEDSSGHILDGGEFSEETEEMRHRITMDWPSRRALYFYARRRARLLVENYWPEIEALARVLMERKELDPDEAGKVLRKSVLRRRGMLMSY